MTWCSCQNKKIEALKNFSAIFLICAVVWALWISFCSDTNQQQEFEAIVSNDIGIVFSRIEMRSDDSTTYTLNDDAIMPISKVNYFYVLIDSSGEAYSISNELVNSEKFIIGETYIMNVNLWEKPSRINYVVRHIERPRVPELPEDPNG